MTDQFQQAAQQEFLRAAAQLKSSKDTSDPLKKSYARYDNLIASTFDNATTAAACKAGCAFCCHYKVEAQAHEILLVAEHIRQRFSAEQRAAVLQKISANAGTIHSLTPAQHLTANIPCALLENSQCSVYAARPFRCRNFHSTDAEACEASFNDPTNMEIATEMIEQVAILADAHTQGFEAAIQQSGRDNRTYDFTTALAEALVDDQVWKRFQRGKKTFRVAVEVAADT